MSPDDPKPGARPLSCSARHWFAPPRQVGLRSPVCIRCGAPNPRPLNEREQEEWAYYLTSVGEYRREFYTKTLTRDSRLIP